MHNPNWCLADAPKREEKRKDTMRNEKTINENGKETSVLRGRVLNRERFYILYILRYRNILGLICFLSEMKCLLV